MTNFKIIELLVLKKKSIKVLALALICKVISKTMVFEKNGCIHAFKGIQPSEVNDFLQNFK